MVWWRVPWRWLVSVFTASDCFNGCLVVFDFAFVGVGCLCCYSLFVGYFFWAGFDCLRCLIVLIVLIFTVL